jgi:hypothetical protein
VGQGFESSLRETGLVASFFRVRCIRARFKLTTARVEAGNVAIGMIRERARGLLDQDHFKLKSARPPSLNHPSRSSLKLENYAAPARTFLSPMLHWHSRYRRPQHLHRPNAQSTQIERLQVRSAESNAGQV